MIALLRQVADAGSGEGAHWARMRIHLIRSDMMVELGSSSKLNAEWAFLSMLRDEGRRAAEAFLAAHGERSRPALDARPRSPARRRLTMGLAGILLGLALLVWLAFRGWSVLLLAPAAALIAAAFAGEPLLAHWTQTFMGSAAQFLAQFFPLFLLGRAVRQADGGQRLGRGHRALHDASGWARSRAMLAVVLAGALVTYGGVSLFVAFFVLAPMAAGAVPRRGHPAPADAGGDRARHLDLHDVGAARHAGDPERDPDAVLRHHAVRRAGPRRDRLGHHAGLRPVVAGARGRRGAAPRRRLRRCVGRARGCAADDPLVRERATTAQRLRPGRDPSLASRRRRRRRSCWRPCRWSWSSPSTF